MKTKKSFLTCMLGVVISLHGFPMDPVKSGKETAEEKRNIASQIVEEERMRSEGEPQRSRMVSTAEEVEDQTTIADESITLRSILSIQRAQENYAAASSLEEQARNSLCREAVPLWEGAIQKMEEARKTYEKLKEEGIVLDDGQEDSLNRTLAKLACYEAQRADCVSRVAQDRALDAPRYTKQQVECWQEAVKEAAKAELAWIKAEQVYQEFHQKAHESVKDWWSKEYHAVACAKNNNLERFYWCEDQKEKLMLSPLEYPSNGERRRLRASEVVESTIVSGPEQDQQIQLRVLKRGVDGQDDSGFVRIEEIFNKISKVVFEKKEMLANSLFITLKEGTDPLALLVQLSPAAKAIDCVLDDGIESSYSLYLNKPFLQSWSNIVNASYNQSLPITYLEPHFLRSRSTVPTDPDSTVPTDPDYRDRKQWSLLGHLDHLNSIDAPRGWQVRLDAPNVPIAILDSGVSFEHEDLQELLKNPQPLQWNSLNKQRRPSDHEGHGTHIVGIVAADSDNNIGITGIIRGKKTRKNKVVICKIPEAVDIHSMNFAAQHAKIFNCSFNDDCFSKLEYQALSNVLKDNIVIVATAGNNYRDIDRFPSYPACYAVDQHIQGKTYQGLKNIVVVAATNEAGKLRESSNYGKCVSIAAPGENIYSTWHKDYQNNRPYKIASGTSVAAPHVTGALALMMEEFPYLGAEQLIDLLLRTTKTPLVTCPQNPRKMIRGGLLNLAKALGHLDTIPPHQLGKWILRLHQEANIADEWAHEAGRTAWNSIDEELWQKAISRLPHVQRAWQKVSEACERGVKLFPDHLNNREDITISDEGSEIDSRSTDSTESQWQQKLKESQENQHSWEARKFLYEAQQAKNIFFASKTDSSIERTDLQNKLDHAQQKWKKVFEVYCQKAKEAPPQFQQSWNEKLDKLKNRTPHWN